MAARPDHPDSPARLSSHQAEIECRKKCSRTPFEKPSAAPLPPAPRNTPSGLGCPPAPGSSTPATHFPSKNPSEMDTSAAPAARRESSIPPAPRPPPLSPSSSHDNDVAERKPNPIPAPPWQWPAPSPDAPAALPECL